MEWEWGHSGELPGAPLAPPPWQGSRSGCPRLGRERTAGGEGIEAGPLRRERKCLGSQPLGRRGAGMQQHGHVRWGVLRWRLPVDCGEALFGQGFVPGTPYHSYRGTPCLSALNSQPRRAHVSKPGHGVTERRMSLVLWQIKNAWAQRSRKRWG